MKRKKILEKRTAALDKLTDMRKIMDGENARSFNAEEQATWDQVNADINQCDQDLRNLDQFEQVSQRAEDQLNENREAGNAPSDDDVNLAMNAWVRSRAGIEVEQGLSDAASRVNFTSRGNEISLSLLRSAPVNPEQVEQRAQSALIGSLGGYTCPVGMVRDIEVGLLQYGSIREHASILRTSNGNIIPWPTVNDASNEGAWIGENGDQSGGSNVEFGKHDFGAHKVSSRVILVPTELLEDSAFDIVNFISSIAGERIGRSQESAYAVGNGVAKPTGIMQDAFLGVTTASAGVFTSDEIIDLVHSVDPAYRKSKSAKFMLHDTILAKVRKLKDGDGRYLWVPGSIKEGEPDRLHGYGIAVNQSMESSTASGKKVISFGDLSKYKIRDVRTVNLSVLKERYADNGQIGILVIMRTDGKLLDAGTHPVKYMKMK